MQTSVLLTGVGIIVNVNSVDFIAEAVSTWRVNNSTNLLLLDAISKKGLLLEPGGPRARNLAQIFTHMHHTRIGWVRWQDPSAVKGMSRFDRGSLPSRAEIKKALKNSAKMVERFLKRSLQREIRIKSFKKHPVRFITYLIMHEAHHRGQIAFALKKAGMRLPYKVADKLWTNWISGKE